MKIEYYEGEEFSEGKWHPIKRVTVDLNTEEMNWMPDETWYELNKLISKITENLSITEIEKKEKYSWSSEHHV